MFKPNNNTIVGNFNNFQRQRDDMLIDLDAKIRRKTLKKSEHEDLVRRVCLQFKCPPCDRKQDQGFVILRSVIMYYYLRPVCGMTPYGIRYLNPIRDPVELRIATTPWSNLELNRAEFRNHVSLVQSLLMKREEGYEFHINRRLEESVSETRYMIFDIVRSLWKQVYVVGDREEEFFYALLLCRHLLACICETGYEGAESRIFTRCDPLFYGDDFMKTAKTKWNVATVSKILRGETTLPMKPEPAARKIQITWRKCITNPMYMLCKNRLNREFTEMF